MARSGQRETTENADDEEAARGLGRINEDDKEDEDPFKSGESDGEVKDKVVKDEVKNEDKNANKDEVKDQPKSKAPGSLKRRLMFKNSGSGSNKLENMLGKKLL